MGHWHSERLLSISNGSPCVSPCMHVLSVSALQLYDCSSAAPILQSRRPSLNYLQGGIPPHLCHAWTTTHNAMTMLWWGRSHLASGCRLHVKYVKWGCPSEAPPPPRLLFRQRSARQPCQHNLMSLSSMLPEESWTCFLELLAAYRIIMCSSIQTGGMRQNLLFNSLHHKL